MSDASDNPEIVPPQDRLPAHVAIVMDGNGRWAKQRHKPRVFGHKAGVETVRRVMYACAEKGIAALTLFAFSTENWKRPKQEVSTLMELFVTSLAKEISELHKNGIKVRFIGDREAFSKKLFNQIDQAETLTQDNTRLALTIAANYGGRWDIAQAARTIAEKVSVNELAPSDITPELFDQFTATHPLPDPDLFIRTGGDHRISNFLLWQTAYSELYFTDTLWPDFDAKAFDKALLSYANRQRRFGQTGEQIEDSVP